MARRKNSLNIDFSAFSEYAEKLDKMGANLKEVFSDAMEDAASDVEKDTESAMASSNLPAKGQFSTGKTKESIIKDAKVSWHGTYGEIGLGFDKSKPGAGGFLITGTPKMQPDTALQDIYSRKKYETKIRKKIREYLQDEIEQRLGG